MKQNYTCRAVRRNADRSESSAIEAENRHFFTAASPKSENPTVFTVEDSRIVPVIQRFEILPKTAFTIRNRVTGW